MITPGENSARFIATWANLATGFRVGLGIPIFIYAIITTSFQVGLFGLLYHWIFDSFDGYLARKLDQETIFGAIFDIIADRILFILFCLTLFQKSPAFLLPGVLLLIEFAGLDLYLSLQFRRWPIKSPNYFYFVDSRIWRLNWSRPAKAMNSGLPIMLLLALPSTLPGIIAISAVIILKTYSLITVRQFAESRLAIRSIRG